MDWGEDRWTGHTHRRTLQSMAVKNTSHSKTVTPDRDGDHVPIRKDELSSGD